MTFVYCGDRWKASKENRQPGPGEYTLNSSFDNEKDLGVHQRPFTGLKKKKHQNNILKDQQKANNFKQWLTTDNFFRDNKIKGGQSKSQNFRKGKLHNSVTCLGKKNEEQSQSNQPFCDLRINNCKKKRNQWGNTKILESLNEHKQNETRSQIKEGLKSHFLLRSNLQAYKTRQKFQHDLKQLETWFQATKKKNQGKNSLKNINREISAKHKTRQMNSHNYTKATGITESVPTFEQNLELYPSNVYRSSQRYEKYCYTPTQSITQQSLAKDDSLPTGCTEDVFEESVEYIENATPGPGSYNYTSSAIKIKKKSRVQKFGVTMDRFKLQRKIVEPQSAINPNYPQFKVSSHANQERIGFGKTKKQRKQEKPLHNGVFYDDKNNIENKIKKFHQKEDKEKIGFGSCKQRFSYQKPRKSVNLQSESEDNDSEIEQADLEKIEMPTNIFLSKVKREFPVNSTTEDVDFAGQNYNCLATKLKKQKQFYLDYEMQPVSFIFRQQRFKYGQQPEKEQIKKQLKKQKLKQLKRRREIAKQQAQKGYTFCKQQFRKSQQKQKEQTPQPKKYPYVPKCIKSPKK